MLDALVSVVMVQMDGTEVPKSIPLCAAHHTQAETILRDSELLSGQSRSVVINLTAASGNAKSGS